MKIKLLILFIILGLIIALEVKGAYTPKNDVERLIREYAREYGVNENTAVRIAWCESKFDIYAKNPNSTAKGIYQWLDGTYKYIGGKDVFNPYENIKLFMIYYPKYPHWWECK